MVIYLGLISLFAGATLPASQPATQPVTQPASQPAEKAGEEQLATEFIQSPKDEADANPFIVRIFRKPGTTDPLKVRIVTGGSMAPDLDYRSPPPIVVIPKDQPHIDLAIYLIDDNIGEGVETLDVSAFLVPK